MGEGDRGDRIGSRALLAKGLLGGMMADEGVGASFASASLVGCCVGPSLADWNVSATEATDGLLGSTGALGEGRAGSEVGRSR